jgi:hypothetical protein
VKPLAVALLIAVACTTSADPTSDLVPPPGVRRDSPPPPEVPDGDLDPSVQAELEGFLGLLLADAFEGEALDQVVEAGDPRPAWFIADLLRFIQSGRNASALASAFTRLTGAPITESGRPFFVPAFDHLIAWDLPAWPGYELLKRRLYTSVEPAWDPFFTENVSLDWRLVTWGGVLIDDRPFGSTGPCPRGCIPALDEPATTGADGGDWYPDEAVVFGVVVNGEAIALPKNQMEVHEMVNLTLGGRHLGIPYCTLCGSAQAYLTDSVPGRFDTAVLRTSGLLSRSNKVMYELETKSVFDTFTGEALTGPLGQAGVVLEQVSVIASTWGEWKLAHPDTRIIAQDGGLGRTYEADPLGTRDDDGPIFPVGPVDPRLGVQEKVLGVIDHDGVPIAFPVESLRSAADSDVEVMVNGITVVQDGDGFRAIGPDGDLPSHEAFWFAWSQFHPETVVWVPLVDG